MQFLNARWDGKGHSAGLLKISTSNKAVPVGCVPAHERLDVAPEKIWRVACGATARRAFSFALDFAPLSLKVEARRQGPAFIETGHIHLSGADNRRDDGRERAETVFMKQAEYLGSPLRHLHYV